MKEFLIGLIFLIGVAVLTGIGFLILPLLFLMAFFLRIILSVLLVALGIWLLGKFIVFVWGTLFKGKE